MAFGHEPRGDLPWFQATSGGLPRHVLQTDARRGECAFDEFGQSAHAAFLRRRHREELLDRVLLLRLHGRRETPNEGLAQRISFRHAGRFGPGTDQCLDLRNRQGRRRIRLTVLPRFRLNLLRLQNGSFKRLIDVDDEFLRAQDEDEFTGVAHMIESGFLECMLRHDTPLSSKNPFIPLCPTCRILRVFRFMYPIRGKSHVSYGA